MNICIKCLIFIDISNAVKIMVNNSMITPKWIVKTLLKIYNHKVYQLWYSTFYAGVNQGQVDWIPT